MGTAPAHRTPLAGRRTLRQETRAALTGLAGAVGGGGGGDMEVTMAALERMGDALRLGIPLPPALKRWAEGLGSPALAAAVSALRREVSQWTRPAGPAFAGDPEPPWAEAVRRRDVMESARASFLRICLPRRISPSSITGFNGLLDDLESFDTYLQSHASRTRVEGLLGSRVELLGEAPWTARFPDEDDAPPSAVAGEPLEWYDVMRAGPPTDAVMTRYIVDGSLARYVEGFAERDGAFAAQLADIIDGLVEMGEPVSRPARKWRRG